MKILKAEKEDIKRIIEGLNEFNLSVEPARAPLNQSMEWVAKSGEGKLIGGVLGSMGYWLGLEVSLLLVDHAYRHNGIGSALLTKIESEARSKGATISMLDTFDFQAEMFTISRDTLSLGEFLISRRGEIGSIFTKDFNPSSVYNPNSFLRTLSELLFFCQ